MWSGKCGGRGMRLCPLSFGVALGITSGLAFFIWSVWVMYHGLPPMMVANGMTMTWSDAITHGLWALVKGFVFGFVVALLYDLVACCCRCKCCRTGSSTGCGCGCKMCATGSCDGCKCCSSKPDMMNKQKM